MALVKQRTALLDSGGSDSDKDDDYQPMDNELPVVVTHQPGAIPCGDDDDEVIPIKIVRPRRVRRKLPGVPKRISKGIHTITGESDVDGRQIHASVDDNWESAV